MRSLVLVCALASLACTVEPDGRVTATSATATMTTTTPVTDDTSPVTDDDALAVSSSESGSGSASTAQADTTTSEDKLDVGGVTTSGCNAIDLLFVIDNSASMNTYQMALSDAFPSFIDALWEALPTDTNVHVGIITTDFGSPGCSGATEGTSACQSTATAAEITMHYDTPLNAPSEINGAQGRLFEYSGQNFFEASTNDDNDALSTWFSGAATAAGENGCTFEMPVAAPGWAFTSPNVGEVSSTNDGFLRNEGTVLLLFFLTDEPDKSPESITTHRDRVLAAKQGCGGDQPDDICVVTAGFIPACTIDVNQKLWQYMIAFGEGEDDVRWGEITDTTAYDELVGTVLADTIAEVCQAIPPVG
jgi:hypothetical protein